MKATLNTLLLASLLPLLLASCGGNAQSSQARYPLTLEVQPANATVWVHESKSTPIAAALEQGGPLASFALPTGDYTYQVSAPGYATYQGHFSLPKNKELSVWLSSK